MTPTKKMPVSGELTGGKAGGQLAQISTPSIHPNRPSRQDATSDRQSMLAQALRYAVDLGWPVLPVDGKKPANGLAYSDASSDPETLGELFTGRVTGVGVRMGGKLRLVAPEIDHKHGATVETFYRLAGVRMGEYKTPTMRTGNGWRMICYVPSADDCNFGNLELDGHGLAVMGNGGQVVLPPSRHPNGKHYQWVPGLEPWNVDVAPCPAGILERVRAKTAHNRPQPAQDGPRAAQPAQPGRYDLATVKSMLDVLKPWQDGYDWWLKTGMAAHSAFPSDAGLAIWEAWAEGKRGECERKWHSFNENGGITLSWLERQALAAGWEPPQPEPQETPEIWRITKEDIKECPLCGTFFHTPTADGRTVTIPLTCGNKDCPGERKHRAQAHFARVLSWDSVYLSVVEDGKPWRKTTRTAKMAGGDWVGITLGGMVLSVTTCPTAGAELVPISEAVQQLTDAIAAMPAGKRIRQPHGMGPRARTRRALTPELRRLRYKLPKEDMPLLQGAYRETGVDFTMRRGRLVSLAPLTAEQVQALGDRLATIAETRRGWRCLAQPMRRLRALQVGTFPTALFNVPIRNGHDPVELSTYRQHGLFLPSEVPIPPP